MSTAGDTSFGAANLPDDILGRFLDAAPDFDTLNAAVGVSKRWQGVFVTHPKAIALSVAHNIVGPALPQAVCFLRYPYPEKEEDSWADPEDQEEVDSTTEDDTEDEDGGGANRRVNTRKEGKPGTKKPEPFSEGDEISELSPQERTELQGNAGIVSQLEEIFSLRHKDRTSETSRLTALESHRFSRAMYRVMLYCQLFYWPLNLDDIDSMEDDLEALEKIQKGRYTMLNQYSTAELLEIRAVVAFLHELIKVVLGNKLFDDGKDICISTGPAVILQAYLTNSSDPFDDAVEPEVMDGNEDNVFFGGFFSIPMKRIWKERKTVPPESEWDAILDVVCGKSDACAQCGVVAGLKLWSEANWKNLINVDFCALLPGKLGQNDIETEALMDLFMSSTCGAEVIVAEILDMKTTDFAAWKKDDILCSACLDKLIGAHLHLWLLKRKAQDGWKPTENCWYGYNCNTQVHKRTHAKGRNHLCIPVR
ncbi:hypothetical protein B0H17DRAFT_330811 [Mycena rosella]|uniref:F-box domain-containing protein n=1 Tax=Mycena rosella TaxID=1033263 RepID=A0AAD7CRN6_MYCRO|nr:hypothetical protein B0H17DRAFT_330811 [Mycena rosella]